MARAGGDRQRHGTKAQAANMVSTSPIELGRPMVIVEPSATRSREQRCQRLSPLHGPGAG